MARTTYSAGPGVVVVGTPNGTTNTGIIATYWSKDDIMITEDFDDGVLSCSAFGKLNEYAKDRKVEITFTPLPMTTYLATIFASLGTAAVGTDLFNTTTDVPLYVIGLDGKCRAYKASALTKFPSINLGMDKDLFGAMTFTCLSEGNKDWSDANSLYTLSDLAWNANSGDIDLLAVQQAYASAAWSNYTTPWNAFTTVDGFTIEPSLSLTPKGSDRYGVQNMMVSGFDVACSFSPNGITEAQIADKYVNQGSNTGATVTARRGALISSVGSGGDLVITQGTAAPIITCTVKGAAIKGVEYAYSNTKARIATVKMVATRTTFTGYMSDLFAISATVHA